MQEMPEPETRDHQTGQHTQPVATGNRQTKASSPTDTHNNCKNTILHPFDHQVGGHTQLMLLDKSTLCKPLVQRELSFYLNIPQELKGFVPKYKGVVEVHKTDGCPILYHPIKGSQLVETVTNEEMNDESEAHTQPELKVQICSCNDRRLLQKDFSSQGRSESQQSYSSRPSQRYFMLLENITSRYHLPCILDLKMGTRQHGEDATDEKRHRQMAKCAASTSASLGFRLCGMQVYQHSLDSYQLVQVDKYYGRKINSETGLKRELEAYFKGRHYLISSVIKRLKELRSILEDLRSTLRFFSTSLLIVSEGCVGRRTTTNVNRKRPNLSSGEDEDDSSMDSMDSSVELKCVKSAKDQRTRRLQYVCQSDHSRQLSHQKIDIRMIDFAHTHFSSQSSTDGFTVGLDNLIRLLDEIREPELRSCEEATEDSDDGAEDIDITMT